jgi:type I restriction enzyme S subunit
MAELKDSGTEWLGEIPDSWRLSRIGSVYELRNTKVSDKEYPPLSVTNKGIVPQLQTAAKTNAHDDRKLVKKGDFAINSRSDRRGSCGISSHEGSVSLINTILAPLGEMNPRYYDWVFHTVQFGDEFYKWGHGIVDDLWTTNWQDMKKITIPMPELDEQEKIATFLDIKCNEIDELFKDIQAEIDTLEEYRMSIINKVLMYGISGKSKHKEVRFKYIATIKSNLVPPTFYLEHPQISPENIAKNTGKLLSYSTVEDSGIISGNHLFYKGQIIYSKIRPNLNKAIIAPFDGLCSADMYPIEAKINSKYLLYAMLSKHFVEQVTLIMQDRVKMPKINQDELGNIVVYIAPDIEQKEIVLYLDKRCVEIDSIIEMKKEQLTVLDEYKKAMIYEYVTGKKEVYV